MIPNDFRRGQRQEQPGEVAHWRPAADALDEYGNRLDEYGNRLDEYGNRVDLARIRAEQAQAAAELARGAADVRGLRQCITDWVMEEILEFSGSYLQQSG